MRVSSTNTDIERGGNLAGSCASAEQLQAIPLSGGQKRKLLRSADGKQADCYFGRIEGPHPNVVELAAQIGGVELLRLAQRYDS